MMSRTMTASRHFLGSSIWLVVLLLMPIFARAQSTTLSDLEALRYIASYPDLIRAYGPSAARGREHYTLYGQKEWRVITFDPSTYLSLHADVSKAFGDDLIAATVHYIQWGYAEGRVTLSDLDALRYIASYPDLIKALGPNAQAGRDHYNANAVKLGRTIVFDPSAYLALNDDVRRVFGNDLLGATTQYIKWGWQEGRCTRGTGVFSTFDSVVTFDSQAPSGTQKITFQNALSSSCGMLINGISITGAEADQFSQTNQCPRVLSANSRCEITVTFSPTGSGDVTAALNVLTSAPGSPHQFALRARRLPISELDVLRYIASYADLTVLFGRTNDAISRGRTHFETYASGQNRKILFDAAAYLARYPDLQRSYGADQTQAVYHFLRFGIYEGRFSPGTASLNSYPSTLSFDSQAARLTRSITITNIGTEALTIRSVSITGADTNQFSTTHNCATLRSGSLPQTRPFFSSCQVNVTFTPIGAENASATLRIESNQTAGAQTVPLTASRQTLSDTEALRYVASYPDLISSIGTDPARARTHYETVGRREGRRPTFDGLAYTASYPDLIVRNNIDEGASLRHYIQTGFAEGRRISFDGSLYLAAHLDLLSVYIADSAAATRHYIQFGYREGRTTHVND